MKNSKFGAISLLFSICLLALSFSSCSTSEEMDSNYYSMGFTNYSYSGSDPDGGVAETAAVEAAFKTALGQSSASFKIDGNTSLADARVTAACAVAKIALDKITFHSSFTFQVTRATTSGSTVIFTYTR